MPARWVRVAIRESESPARTRYSSADAAADFLGSATRGGSGAAATGLGMAGFLSAGRATVAGGSKAGFAVGDAIAGAAGAARAAGAAGTGAAAIARLLGGSNNKVYSRTRRPVDQVNSKITSTNGS